MGRRENNKQLLNGSRVSFRDDKNALELNRGDGAHYEYTRCQWIVRVKWLILCNMILSKVFFKRFLKSKDSVISNSTLFFYSAVRVWASPLKNHKQLPAKICNTSLCSFCREKQSCWMIVPRDHIGFLQKWSTPGSFLLTKTLSWNSNYWRLTKFRFLQLATRSPWRHYIY